jgi:hypothetical protein
MRGACAESCSSCMTGEMEKLGVSNLEDVAAEGRWPVFKCSFATSQCTPYAGAPRDLSIRAGCDAYVSRSPRSIQA